jgi:hypothetical protein
VRSATRSGRAARIGCREQRRRWDPLPFDAEAARAYGRLFAAAKAAGRTSRARLADLLIAATAAANGLPLYSRNPSDFSGLERILSVKAV